LPRARTTKTLAQRIDLNYFKRPSPFKRAKFWLSVLAPALALVWILFHAFAHDPRVYSSGRLSEPHAVLEKQCAACHMRQADAFSAEVSDSACLSCHDGPVHHADAATKLSCSACHTEHRGRINIAATSDRACASCHSNLQAHGGRSQFASHIVSFEDGHPEFAVLRSVACAPPSDLGTIKLNHAIHMKPIRVGPNGPIVQLDCDNCHRPPSVDADLTYSDPAYRAATVSYKFDDEFLAIPSGLLQTPEPVTGREFMAPVKFANACARCHLLTFDKRFNEGVPHDSPEVIHAFLVKKFTQYIAAHTSELRVVREPQRDLTGKPIPPAIRFLTPAEWIAERTADAEDLLWRKTCKQCHTLHPYARNAPKEISQSSGVNVKSANAGDSASPLPEIAPANLKLRWLPHSNFSHDAHRGFSCVSCHQKALTSTESSDILIPRIATCKKCHAPGPGHAESRCFECHTYHDWSKRKEIKPNFTLPSLLTAR
jgi:hypothetical protein